MSVPPVSETTPSHPNDDDEGHSHDPKPVLILIAATGLAALAGWLSGDWITAANTWALVMTVRGGSSRT